MKAFSVFQPRFRIAPIIAIVFVAFAGTFGTWILSHRYPHSLKSKIPQFERDMLQIGAEHGLPSGTNSPKDFRNYARLDIRRLKDGKFHVVQVLLITDKPDLHMHILKKLPELSRVMIPFARNGQLAKLRAEFPAIIFSTEFR